jgi:hypothetical protein
MCIFKEYRIESLKKAFQTHRYVHRVYEHIDILIHVKSSCRYVDWLIMVARGGSKFFGAEELTTFSIRHLSVVLFYAINSFDGFIFSFLVKAIIWFSLLLIVIMYYMSCLLNLYVFPSLKFSFKYNTVRFLNISG